MPEGRWGGRVLRSVEEVQQYKRCAGHEHSHYDELILAEPDSPLADEWDEKAEELYRKEHG